MIIDIHAYCGNWPYWPIPITTGGGLLELMDRFRIDVAAITSTRGIFIVPSEGNADTLRNTMESPSRLIGFATASPTDDDASTQAKEYLEAGMQGLRLFPQHHGYRLDDDPVLLDLLEVAADRAMPVLIPVRIMGNWSMPALDVRQIGELAARFPSVQFIAAGINYGEVRDTLGVMRRYDNIVIETSCLQLHGGVKLFVDRVGAERVLFGSGMPLQYPGAGLAKITHAEISDNDRQLILGGNAARLLGIPA